MGKPIAYNWARLETGGPITRATLSDMTTKEGIGVPAEGNVEPENVEAPTVVETADETGSEKQAETAEAAGTTEQAASAEAVDGGAAAVTAEAAETGEARAENADAEDPAKRAAEQKARQARVAPLFRAYRGGRPINGHVEKAIKGGYEIRIGKARAFCPHSQIDTHRVDDPESFVGKSHSFRITQLRRGGDDVVVSRRAVIEADRREEAAAVRATLIEGAVMLGRVAGMARFGAFVDLGAGVTGLVHITELSHGRVNRADQAVEVGEAVRVKILKLQDGNDRISLSIRQASEDPWASVNESFQADQVVPGKVLRLADFGAFVELTPGVEALAPASEFPPKAGGWKDGLAENSEHQWRVLKVDAEQRRISLTFADGGEVAPIPELAPGVEMKGKVQRIEKFGVFVWLGPGKVGLMPNVLTGTPPGTDLARRFPVADEIDVEIVGIDDRGKIRLAAKGAAQQQAASGRANGRAESHGRGDRPRRRGPKSRPERVPDQSFTDNAEGFGSLLADKLKDALG